MTVAVPDDAKLAPNINYDSNSDCDYVPYEDEDDEEIPRTILQSEVLDFNGKPINTQSITDQIIGLELSLPQGERMTPAKVIGLSMDEEGKVICKVNEIPILNTICMMLNFPMVW
jgi:hypothetical protein